MMANTSVARSVSVYAVTKMSAKMAAYTTKTWAVLPTVILWLLACNSSKQGVSCGTGPTSLEVLLLVTLVQHLSLPACAAFKVHGGCWIDFVCIQTPTMLVVSRQLQMCLTGGEAC